MGFWTDAEMAAIESGEAETPEAWVQSYEEWYAEVQAENLAAADLDERYPA